MSYCVFFVIFMSASDLIISCMYDCIYSSNITISHRLISNPFEFQARNRIGCSIGRHTVAWQLCLYISCSLFLWTWWGILSTKRCRYCQFQVLRTVRMHVQVVWCAALSVHRRGGLSNSRSGGFFGRCQHQVGWIWLATHPLHTSRIHQLLVSTIHFSSHCCILLHLIFHATLT